MFFGLCHMACQSLLLHIAHLIYTTTCITSILVWWTFNPLYQDENCGNKSGRNQSLLNFFLTRHFYLSLNLKKNKKTLSLLQSLLVGQWIMLIAKYFNTGTFTFTYLLKVESNIVIWEILLIIKIIIIVAVYKCKYSIIH